MARKHYWQFLVTDEGNPIENASISIYEAGSETAVWVYTDEIGGSGNASDPQVNTSKKGFFEFWIATDNEANGYPIGTKFKIAWSAPGVSGGYIDFVDVFSTAVEPVLLGDTNPDLNKAVSNALATGWENHKNWDVTVDGQPIHGIYGVDVGDTDSTLSKLVSNAYGKRWTEHESTNYDGTTDIFAPPTNPHGIEEADATFVSTNTDLNKLVSDNMVRTWQRHVINTTEDHIQYPLLDGTRDFTAVQHGVTPTSGDTGTSLITKNYIDGEKYSTEILVGDGGWTLSGGIYYIELAHNQSIALETPPIVQVWDLTTNKLIVPLEVENLDTDTVRLDMLAPTHVYVRMQW